MRDFFINHNNQEEATKDCHIDSGSHEDSKRKCKATQPSKHVQQTGRASHERTY